MKVARSSTARASTQPVHQIQFDEGADDFVDQEKMADLRKRYSGSAVLLGLLNYRFTLLPCVFLLLGI